MEKICYKVFKLFILCFLFSKVENESDDFSRDEEFEFLLKEFKIAKLYKKFRRYGVTLDILWDIVYIA